MSAVHEVKLADGDMPEEMSQQDWLELTARRGIEALQNGEKDFAEELFIDILYLIGRGPKV